MPHLSDHPLFRPGARWVAEGQYMEEGGHVLPAWGTWRLERDTDADGDEIWRLHVAIGLVLMQGHQPAFKVSYRLEPADNGARDTFWAWESVSLGPFVGRFTPVADSVMNSAFAENGQLVLAECFIGTEDRDAYLCRGALSRDSVTIASWALTWEPEVAP